MYIYVCSCVSCSVAVLFTCTLGRSCPDSYEGVKCETRSIGTNSKILGGPGQTRNILEKKDQEKLSLSLDRGHKDVFARCSKKMAAQVCTKL
jgi:hypothetical protein